jgi:hypothetical protein
MEVTVGRTRLQLVEGDIAAQDTDAVVTAAHQDLEREPHQLDLARLVLHPEEAPTAYPIHAAALEELLRARPAGL